MEFYKVNADECGLLFLHNEVVQERGCPRIINRWKSMAHTEINKGK